MIGLANCIETTMCFIDDDGEETNFPCIIEFEVNKLSYKKSFTDITCFINNSITFENGRSIEFDFTTYKTGKNKKDEVKCWNLQGLLTNFNDYSFTFHVISPHLRYGDQGKTEVDISECIDELLEKSVACINKERKKHKDETKTENPQPKKIAMGLMEDAFLLSTSNNTRPIIARQLFYKVRELAIQINPAWGNVKGDIYYSFSQNWLTEWMNDNPQYEDKIHFSDRGNFYFGNQQHGLGTASVLNFIENDERKSNKFKIHGGLQDSIFIDDTQFSLKYKCDKCLFVEKTGLDTVFQEVGISEKYNMMIVSGQGFGTRAANELLNYCQKQSLTLFCLHDLDIYGMSIYQSLCEANDKCKHPLTIIDISLLLMMSKNMD